MTAPDVIPSPSQPDRRAALADAFADCRAQTLTLFDGMADCEFREQIHPGYSPLGWHLGHIAYTEAHWLVRGCGRRPLPRPELERIFHVDGLPKPERGAIPDRTEVGRYAEAVRHEMLDCLETVDLDRYERHWRFVLQHECQHAETVSLLLACRDSGRAGAAAGWDDVGGAPDWLEMQGGEVTIGDDSSWALDNEGPAFTLSLAPFRIARQPVTQRQYAAFMLDGGYKRPEFWTEAGWAWREAGEIEAPLYWDDDDAGAPATGVSGHEADAYACWAGARLPTEFEWEAAAQQASADFPGQVWQWTSSVFLPYSGFRPWPYSGYSQAYFDGEHRVLRGGSHATRPWAMRMSFRNWYMPGTRELIAGIRLAAN